MKISKACWGLRLLFYKFIGLKCNLPGYLGKPIYISRLTGLVLGKRVRIYPGLRAEIGDKESRIIIGNNTSIGQNFHVVSYDDKLMIGNNVVIAGNVLVTNCDHDYKSNSLSVLDSDLILKKTEIGDGCFIGNNACILAGTILGKNCVVGANSVVRGVYEDGSLIVGAPAKAKVRIIEDGKNEKF